MSRFTTQPISELPSDVKDILTINYVGNKDDIFKDYYDVFVCNTADNKGVVYTNTPSKFQLDGPITGISRKCDAVVTADMRILRNRYGGDMKMPQKIYIAGSFSTPEQRKELEEFIEVIRKRFPSSELFIPMEHFVPGGNDKDSNGNYIMPNEVWGRKVFEMDLEGLSQCDAVANLYRGHISGTGTSWELGYAYATGKYIIQSIPDSVKVASVMCYNCANTHIGNKTVEQK